MKHHYNDNDKHDRNSPKYNGDRDIRTLNRQSDDPYAQARLLREKVRSGLLIEDRLVMAARLGHEPSRLAVPEWENFGEILFDDYQSCNLAIDHIDHREKVSFACDCAERVLHVFESVRPNDMRPRHSIEAARVWLVSPSVDNSVHAGHAGMQANIAASMLGNNVEVVAAGVAASYAGLAASVDRIYARFNVNCSVSYADRAAGSADEYLWQQQRLIQYLIGEVQLPTIKTTRRNSDRDLRTLERRAAEGDRAAAVGLLRARMRAGLLSQERLNMAARLGDKAAREAGGIGSLFDWTSFSDRTEALALMSMSRKTMAELACKWTESALPIWERRYPNDMRPRIAIEATRKWIDNPTPELAQAAYQAAMNSVDASMGLLGTSEWCAARSVADAARVPFSVLSDEPGNINSAAWNTAMAAGDAASAISLSKRYFERSPISRNSILESQIPDVIRAILTPDTPS